MKNVSYNMYRLVYDMCPFTVTRISFEWFICCPHQAHS